ncbi:MAG: flavoprotein [Pseudonocardiaceae bacterium]
MTERVLYLVICAAGPAGRVDVMVNLARAAGWSVYCLATPAAVEYFLDVPALTALTGHPVRTTYRASEDESLPRADAIVVAPATYNTINKWAAGIADNYVLNQLAELTGLGAHIVVLPFVNQGLAANHVFVRSVEELRQAGVRVLFGPGEFEPHPPRTGGTVLDSYPWERALAAAQS